MRSSFAFFVPLLTVASVTAHGFLSAVQIDGRQTFKVSVPESKTEDSPIRQIKSGFPIYDTFSPDIACGTGSKPAALVVDVNPGSKLEFSWLGDDLKLWPHDFGAVLTYMTSCGQVSCDKFDIKGAKWFKIDQLGRKPGSQEWFEKDLTDGKSLPATIPPNLASGGYIVQNQVLGLHLANEKPGKAEFYSGCVQVKVGGDQTGQPKAEDLVTFPGAYDPKDPGLFDPKIFDDDDNYKFPGPPVASFISGGAPPTNVSQPASPNPAQGTSPTPTGGDTPTTPTSPAPASNPTPADDNSPTTPTTSTESADGNTPTQSPTPTPTDAGATQPTTTKTKKKGKKTKTCTTTTATPTAKDDPTQTNPAQQSVTTAGGNPQAAVAPTPTPNGNDNDGNASVPVSGSGQPTPTPTGVQISPNADTNSPSPPNDGNASVPVSGSGQPTSTPAGVENSPNPDADTASPSPTATPTAEKEKDKSTKTKTCTDKKKTDDVPTASPSPSVDSRAVQPRKISRIMRALFPEDLIH